MLQSYQTLTNFILISLYKPIRRDDVKMTALINEFQENVFTSSPSPLAKYGFVRYGRTPVDRNKIPLKYFFVGACLPACLPCLVQQPSQNNNASIPYQSTCLRLLFCTLRMSNINLARGQPKPISFYSSFP